MLLLSMLLLTAVGCSFDEARNPASADKTQSCSQVSYGPDLVYFPCSGATFGFALAEWQQRNPTVHITAITGVTGGDGGVYGRTTGFFVVMEGK